METLIKFTDVANNAATNEEGLKLFIAISNEIKKGNDVCLSLLGCPPMSSSFLNSSFGELIDSHGVELIRHSIRLINYKPSYATRIADYMDSHHK